MWLPWRGRCGAAGEAGLADHRSASRVDGAGDDGGHAVVAGEESTRAVVTALAANLGIAVSKFVAAAVTGSSAMLAEGVHSVAALF